MKIKTITTWNNNLFEAYAHRLQETYNWPFELVVYNEDDEILPDLKSFVERNKHRQPMSDFRKKVLTLLQMVLDLVIRFIHILMLLQLQRGDGLICIDADSVFHKKIDEDWVKKHIHRDDCMMTYLGRGNHYSECGFLYFNLKHKDTKAYAKE